LEEGLEESERLDGKQKVTFLVLFSAVLASSEALSGEEVALLDLVGERRHHYEAMNHSQPDKRRILAVLLGQFKTETGEKYHLVPCTKEAASGLKKPA
jgi:hypothetical protein